MRAQLLWTFLVFAFHGLQAQQDAVDFLRGDIEITPFPVMEILRGAVDYTFNLNGQADSLRIDARNMEFHRVLMDGKPAPYAYQGRNLRLQAPAAAGTHRLRLEYTARPSQTVYFMGWVDQVSGNEQIWTQGQGKYSSHWVPSFDAMEEKVIFSLKVHFSPAYTVVANGRLEGKSQKDSLAVWEYRMQQPMSSYLLAFAIGDFDHLEDRSASGVPIKLYYPKGEEAKARLAYSGSAALFDFLEAEIGVPYPWQEYKQVPVWDFLYAGMENTGATFFADTYLVDSLGWADREYTNVNAHELAHQWFGNLVTETDGGQHWLHEGFATYYAYLAQAALKGEEDLYWNLLQSAEALEGLSGEQARALLDPGAGSLVFYEKGAWALFALRELVGDAAFGTGIRRYLQHYAYANATVADFLQVMEEVYGKPLDGFSRQWLQSEAFPSEAAFALLGNHLPALAGYREYREGDAGRRLHQDTLMAFWDRHDAPRYREALLRQYAGPWTPNLFEAIHQQGHVTLVRLLAERLTGAEPWMRPYLDAWMEGASYRLREAAFFWRWQGFPAERARILNRMAANGSLGHLPLQQLWWLLAVATDGYQDPGLRMQYLDALRESTRPWYRREVRENAFRLLQQVDALSEENLRDLIQATEHHAWEFRLFCRRMLDRLMAGYRDPAFWKRLGTEFPQDKFRYFHSKLNEL
ncbi:M1 family aminopeptidase [Robiginitalea sp. M366]|uniref:M1 family metallopeptidase n=1 Tax=Robiginitalea aestuariiviva TaxID=3036903 RepID=UPI00240E4DF6|nr:M1 family aminopeptidase [Robiginitalea aestuariiviva]MDG1572845.1 M1 family aminopeptidase [Robiginitalea aestuariiviva]